MAEAYTYYNLFSPEGKLLQVEYALSALSKSPPILIARSGDGLVLVAKASSSTNLYDLTNIMKKSEPSSGNNDSAHSTTRPDPNQSNVSNISSDMDRGNRSLSDSLVSLNIESGSSASQHIFRLTADTYCLLTGAPFDIPSIKRDLQIISNNLRSELGTEPPASVIARFFATETAKRMQRSGKRLLAFATAIFDANTDIFYTDTSAVFFQLNGTCVGENSSKGLKFLEKHINDICPSELEEVVLEAFSQAFGGDLSPSDVVVGRLKKGQDLQILSENQVDDILLRISEKN